MSQGGGAGIRKCYPHRFRNAVAINYVRDGGDVFRLQRLLGQEKIEATRVYLTALSDQDVEERAKRTSPADN